MLEGADQQQLDRVLALVHEVLGVNATAAYLFGSAVLGGLRPESDLDVLVVSNRPTTDQEKERFVRRLLAISGRQTAQGRWRRVELTIVVERDIKPWRYPPSFDFLYGDWLRGAFESGNIAPWPTGVSPDLTTLIAMTLRKHRILFGPRPSDIFDSVPHHDVIRAMTSDIDRLRDDLASDTCNVILTFARIWSTVATGSFRAKDTAADWALERLPEFHRPVLARARAIYLGDGASRWDNLEDRITPCVDHVIGEINALLKR